MAPRSLASFAALLTGAALAAATGAAEPARPRVITICSDPWLPYAGDGTAGSDEGYVIALAREALARSGYSVRYVVAPWSRCIADVRSGRWDAIACVDAREIEDAVYPSEPVGETRTSVFTRATSTWRYTGPASLEGLRLGGIQNYAYAVEIDGWIRDHAGDTRRVFLASGTDPLHRLIEMLDAGRVDAILENRNVMAWAARRLGRPPGSLREAGVVGPPVLIFVGFSSKAPDGPALARAFDRGVEALRAEGKLATLLARYQIPPWPHPDGRTR